MTQLSNMEVPTELKAAIAEIAEQAHRSEADVAAEALRTYLRRNADYLRRVRAGLEAAEDGDFASIEEMEALFTRLTTEG
jgi:predicted transcriptional regulator